MRLLTHYGLKPVEKDMDGDTSLHTAAASCNSEALTELLDQLLIEDGLMPAKAMNKSEPQSIMQRDRKTSLHLEKLAEYVNFRNNAEETLLHVSASDLPVTDDDEAHSCGVAYSEITKTLDLLVDYGSNVNAVSASGKTPLLLMCDRGSPMITMKHVISRGADPNFADLIGKSPLHYAAEDSRQERAEILLDAGANVDARDCNLCSPLHMAVKCAPPTMQILITRGADIESQSASGKRPIHYAAERVWSENVRMLARRGADVNCVDASGSTALHVAATNVYKDIVHALIGSGANPEAIDDHDRSPLHCAAEYEDDLEDKKHYHRNPVQTWLALYYASEKCCKATGTRPHTLLKRVSSQIIRKNKCWDDFSKVKSNVLAET